MFRRVQILILSIGAAGVLAGAVSLWAEEVQFVSVTEEAGISGFRHTWGDEELSNILEETGSGVAFVDYDGDGWLDIYAINCSILEGETEDQPTNVLYRNNGDGTFADVTEEAGAGDTGYGMACAFADYDNDGDLDLYVGNYGPNVLYRNNGDGTFTDVTGDAGVGDDHWAVNPSFVDYDGDGDLDLYIGNYLDYYPGLAPQRYVDPRVGTSLRSFKEGFRWYPGPWDYNGQPDVLYRNNGDGTFTDVSEEAGIADPNGKAMSINFSDYDDDGDPDIYVPNDRWPNYLYRNEGDGTFSEIALETGVAYDENGHSTGGMCANFSDYDQDGHMDMFVTNMAWEMNSLYQNNGDGTFEDVSTRSGANAGSFPYACWSNQFMDYDNDGYSDIFAVTGHIFPYTDKFSRNIGYAQDNLMYRNNGDGTFTFVSKKLGEGFGVRTVSRGAAIGDYDNDGDMDILIANANDHLVLLRNDGGNANNWIQIRTGGTSSNRSGIGAKIWATAGPLKQIMEVRSSSGYLSQSDMRVHFGLGREKKVDLKIRWPSGIVQTLKGVSANQVLTVREPVEQ